MIYNNEDLQDVINVLTFIDKYSIGLGVPPVVLDTSIIQRVVQACKLDFPHNGGIQQASGFKQAANFICNFVAERPILEPFSKDIIGEDLAKIDNHQNSMIAFALAEESLNKSQIQRKDGNFVVNNPIALSKHSYVDIIDALSTASPVTHFKLVSVLLEQLVYKSNPDCQYKTI